MIGRQALARYGVAHTLQMMAYVVAPPDSNCGGRALRERRALLDARRALMEGGDSLGSAEHRSRFGVTHSRPN
jgi:hypothetical protein